MKDATGTSYCALFTAAHIFPCSFSLRILRLCLLIQVACGRTREELPALHGSLSPTLAEEHAPAHGIAEVLNETSRIAVGEPADNVNFANISMHAPNQIRLRVSYVAGTSDTLLRRYG